MSLVLPRALSVPLPAGPKPSSKYLDNDEVWWWCVVVVVVMVSSECVMRSVACVCVCMCVCVCVCVCLRACCRGPAS